MSPELPEGLDAGCRGKVCPVRRAVTIRFEGIGKRFGRRVVLRDVSGRAAAGSVLVLTGPNGSGKSTLLQIIAGLIRPTRGRVRYLEGGDDGTEIPREAWRHRLGMAAPALAMYEELTAMENLEFCARVRGLPADVDMLRKRIAGVGLDPDRRTPVGAYSTGMQQRLKLAQAVLHDPDVVLLDEPGANLDPEGQDWLEGFVRELAGEGRTIVVATNDRDEMAWGTDRVALSG